ncbi:MAG: DUF721 domain-containing protein [Kiritimatiellae bacterium]|nr:DUF721 domain-containing protein [Kiritimatiellia bacterium]
MKRKADDVSPENGEEGWREELPPSPEDFYARPIGKRRELTDNDRKRNQGVDKLFEVMIPGLPIDTDPSETRTSEQQIAQSIEKLLKRLDLGVSPWIGELTEAWTKILPPEVTDFTRPGKWENDILYVFVTSSVRLFEIRRAYLKNIERAVRDLAGDRFQVRQVRLMVNSVPMPTSGNSGHA